MTMARFLANLLLIAPISLGIFSSVANVASATEELEPLSGVQKSGTGIQSIAPPTGFPAIAPESTQSMEQDPVLESTWMAQITSVSQLSDVNQSDWAFQALQSLVDRYGCIVGYPNQSYRGNRALSRYEFAAGLNACLEQVNGLLASGSASLVQKEDLDNLQKLQEEFAAELATVRGRVDALEVRTTTLEQQQFSTTTKLHGEVIFAVAGVATGQDADNRDIARITTFSDRVRLNLDTSFTGKDLLRTRLQALNSNSFFSAAGTGTQLPEGTLAFNAELDDEGPESNGVGLDTLYYQFPIGKKARVTLFANEGEVDDFTNTVNPFLDGDDGASGALSKFGSRNSVYYFVPQGTGIGFQYQFSDQIELSLGYLSSTASNPSAKRGLFNGSYGAIAQLSIQPSDRISLGFTYVNAYNNLGEDLVSPGTGSQKANLGLVTDEPVISNAYGIEASVQITPNFFINGWVGYTRSRVVNVGDADIWNYAVALAFPDLGGRGNLAGILVGMEPKVTGADRAIADAFTEVVSDDNEDSARDRNTSLHVEVFYTLALSDNIAITPGLIWLTAPNHDNRNDDIVIGVIRTTFFF